MKKLLFLGLLLIFLVGTISAFNWEDNSLMAYYDFENTTATQDDLIDGTGQYNGALTNMDPEDDWVTGALGFGLDLDGIDDYISIGNFSETKPINYTLSFWIKPNAWGDVAFSSSTAAGANKDIWGVILRGSTNDQVEAWTSDGVTGQQGILSNNSYSRNWNATHFPSSTWTYFVVTANNTHLSYYHNSTLISSQVRTVTNGGIGSNLSIGRNGEQNGFYLNGIVDEFGIWNRSLNSSEVTELYNGGTPLNFALLNAPYVELIYPPNDLIIVDGNITFICFVNGTYPIANVSLMLDGVLNTTNVTGTNNTNYTFNLQINVGAHNWTCDALNNESESTSPTVRDFTVTQFTLNSETFNVSAFETQSRTFKANVTTIENIQSISSFLFYNGTAYAADESCSEQTCILSKTIDIPLMTSTGDSENKTFFWQINVFDGDLLITTQQNTTEQEQNVSRLIFGECGIGTQAVNFSFFKESDQLTLSADFDSTFTYYLGSGTVTKQNITVNATTNNVSFCVNREENYTVNSQIELSSTGYETRLFNFIKEIYINTSVTAKSLYLLNSSASSDIIIEVKNPGLKPLSGILVNISKFLPSTGNFIQVESQLTDDFGQFVANLIENDAKYKFEFYDEDGTLLKTSPVITIACRASICIIPFVIEIVSNDFDEFKTISDYVGTLTFDNITNTFAFSWDDKTGETTTTRLEVIRYTLNGSSIVCNTTSTSTLDIISCAVGNTRASYKAQAFRTVAGEEERRVAILNINVGSPTDTFGVEGLLWVFLLLFTMLGIGVFNPTIGVTLYGVGFIFMGILGIISMPIEVFFANTLIVIIFIWGVNRQ